MSRRRRSGESSLELLLDTICNTFGGILFVAILIVVMLRMTSKTEASHDAQQVSEAEMLELEQEQTELTAMLETLRRISTDLDKQITSSGDTVELSDELRKAQKSRHALIESRIQALGQIAEHQARINRTSREINELDARLKTALNKQQGLEANLKSEIEKRSQRADYSATRSTGKTEIQTVLRYGRFYLWHRHGVGGSRRGLNTDDFVILSETGGEIRTTPMPHAGTPVSDSAESTNQLVARLKQFDSSRDYIAILVWPDSFAQFRTLKKVLVSNGFEYRLIPSEADGKFQDRGGPRGAVQ